MPLVVMLLTYTAALGQSIVGRAPAQVAVGEQFRLTYTVNTDNVEEFRAGNIPEALEVLMGPSTSSQSSFQMVNGKTSSSSSVTFTYIVSANKAGNYTIPAARAKVDGKQMHSNVLHVKVSGSASSSQQGRGQRSGNDSGAQTSSGHISGNALFMKVSANKSRVHEQEPILLTYKVYTLVNLTSLTGKMPDLKSFYTREVPLPQQKSFHIETLNGRPYRTVTWQQYVMFPQTTGKLEIPSLDYEGMVMLENRDVDPFEAFFNGGSGYTEVKKVIKAPGLTVTVDPLPAHPSNFSGGVGTFSLSASLDKDKVKANDPVTLRIVVSGVGNMKLIKQPTIVLPKDFDQYDAKVTDKTKLSTNGIEGNMVYDVLIVPRHQGTYELQPVEFVYFDTKSGSYKTLRSQPFTLKVQKGNGGGSRTYASEELQQVNKDIRYIKTGDIRPVTLGDSFFASLAYWIVLAVLLGTFVTLFVVFRQRAIDRADIVKMRGKRANKVASRRLRKAAKLMKANSQNEFYDEVLRALWGYVGDKLNIPVAQLSRENISAQLNGRGATADTIQLFLGALDECEFARYAPGDAHGNMNKVYDAAVEAITSIEKGREVKS